MRLGLQIPTYEWATAPDRLGADLGAIARTADDAGFTTLSVADHLLQAPMVSPPETEMLEAYSTLAYIAGQTSRAELLTVVTGVTLRHPGVLAKTVTTLDVLSGGRAWLGIGAAWFEDEHRSFGVPFPAAAERLERLEETVQICLQMWRGDQSPYVGKHYQLSRPINCPQSVRRPHPPILIGGSGERVTLKLVARYADACNLQGPPRTLAQRLEALRRHCDEQGRDYGSIEKTCMVKFDLERRDPDVVVKTLRELAAIGIDRAFGPIKGVEWLPGLEIMARDVVPRITDL
jgi:F420-dependent oxidoreductase-like protein